MLSYTDKRKEAQEIMMKNTKYSTERYLIRQNKTECKFSREPRLQSHKQYKNKQITQLLPAGSFQKDVCETDVQEIMVDNFVLKSVGKKKSLKML